MSDSARKNLMKMKSSLILILAAGLCGCSQKTADSTSQPVASVPQVQTPVVAAPEQPKVAAMDTFAMPLNTQTTASGLQYVIDQPGTGAQPNPGQKVRVHYTGWLTNGTKFDSSRDRGA